MARFKPGQSGNPKGRPAGGNNLYGDYAKKHCFEAIDILVDKMNNSKSEKIQVMAASEILDRGLGRPMQPLVGDNEGNPLRIIFRAAPDLSESKAR